MNNRTQERIYQGASQAMEQIKTAEAALREAHNNEKQPLLDYIEYLRKVLVYGGDKYTALYNQMNPNQPLYPVDVINDWLTKGDMATYEQEWLTEPERCVRGLNPPAEQQGG